MRKVVSEEMVAAAVEHCRREGQNPSRGRVMGLLAQKEFGECAGDPANVGRMIREHLDGKEEMEVSMMPAGDVSGQHLPPQVEAVLAQTAQMLSESMCSMAESLAGELAEIKSELRSNYDQAADQLRRAADRAVAAAQADEQDAINSLEDALAQKALLEERAEVMRAEHSTALAVAAERGEQLQRIEAELDKVRTEAAATRTRLVVEREEVRKEAQTAVQMVEKRDTLISALEERLNAAQGDLADFRQQAAVSQALADERATRITQLESLLTEALRDIQKPAQTSVNTPESATHGQGSTIACAEVAVHPEGNQVRPRKDDGKAAKPAKPAEKNPSANTADVQDSNGLAL